MDKVASKRIFESHGIPTPRWRLLPGQGVGPADGSDGVAALADFGYPLVVKPADEGSSVGVSVVDDASQCAAAVALARQHHGPVLVEEYIAGTEVFVGIVDGEVLGSVEVRPATRFYDYEAKYLRNDTQYLLPPEVAPDVLARCEAHALAAYKALGCSGHSRPDLRIDRAGNAFVLEVNTRTIGSPSSTSSLVTHKPLMPLIITVRRTATASSQPQRRARPVVAPYS